jgi:hypothetical protein
MRDERGHAMTRMKWAKREWALDFMNDAAASGYRFRG